ncbi:unnamed protein product [Protopolystoma xenopodis]|uniref:Uncharacterized protein n=1 Tax=Protopolystoma xenopodis TaxID=117903 RepID=A0A448WF53_9PLAT|nr:unnamed protein product [Protopolystoma xenopodis]
MLPQRLPNPPNLPFSIVSFVFSTSVDFMFCQITRLVIRNFTRKDAGYYTCRTPHNTEAPGRLELVLRPQLLADYAPSPPKNKEGTENGGIITGHQISVALEEGTKTQLTCRINPRLGFPNVTQVAITWYFQGQHIISPGEVEEHRLRMAELMAQEASGLSESPVEAPSANPVANTRGIFSSPFQEEAEKTTPSGEKYVEKRTYEKGNDPARLAPREFGVEIRENNQVN